MSPARPLPMLQRAIKDLRVDAARRGGLDVEAARELVAPLEATLAQPQWADDVRVRTWTGLARLARPGAPLQTSAEQARRAALVALGLPVGAETRELLLWGHLTGGRGHDVVSDPHHVTVDLQALTPLARAVAEAIETNSRRSPGALVRLRSVLTRRQIADQLQPAHRDRLLEQARAYSVDLDGHDEVPFSRWEPYRAGIQTPEVWCEEAAALLPAGYVPVPTAGGDTPAEAREVAAVLTEQVNRVRAATAALADARTTTEDVETHWRSTVAAALAAGVPAKTIADATGIHRTRVYQIRDGRRCCPTSSVRPSSQWVCRALWWRTLAGAPA